MLFGDNNVMILPKHSHELFEVMVPLRKHCVRQTLLLVRHAW